MSHTPMYDTRDVAQFRLSRAIMAAGENNFHNTWEYGLLREAAERSGRAITGNGFFVPFELMQRDLTTSTASPLVAVETPAALDVLRPASKVLTASAQMYDVTGNVSLPRVTQSGTAYWLAGDGSGAVTPSQTIIGAMVMTPKNVVSMTTVSGQLARQVTHLDAFLAREMVRTTGVALDLAVLAGSGVSGEVQGIHNTEGVGTAVVDATSTFDDVLSMVEAVTTANGQNITFIAPPAVERLLAGRPRWGGGGRAIWDDGFIHGKPAYSVTGVPAGTLTAGDFGQVIIGIFGDGLTIEVDPFTGFNTGAVSFRSWLTCDVGLVTPSVFSVATSVS